MDSRLLPRDSIAREFAWASIPTDLLLEELAKRQDADTKPTCGSEKRGSYDLPLHIFALFLILTLSTGACGFPLISRRSSKTSRRRNTIIFYCQHFGTGVLIATAFVHLLPTAFTSLNDPCLPDAFSKNYREMPGLIAMASALAVVAVESYLTTRGAGHSHAHHAGVNQVWGGDDDDDMHSANGANGNSGLLPSVSGTGLAAKRENGRRPDDIPLADMETQGLVAGASPLPGSTPMSAPLRTPVFDAEMDDDDESDLAIDPSELHSQALHPPSPAPQHRPRPLARSDSMATRQDPEGHRKLLIQCLLLEAGILFHSIFIGMAISVAQGGTFIVFLIAISFHQTFEGLALGSRIAAIHFPRQSIRPWLMVLAFGCTTPLGQAIGLVVHNLYDPLSQTGLLVVGFMNAISSGLLLFAGLVQLLAEDFLSEKSYETLNGKKRVKAYFAVLGGAGLMSVVGAFA
ncbi:Zinc-regulated transporter 2 [Zalerion maritima]|uniref:Zinc-regulated transporter 2 n=1 Tax=Zalerion maritima TaxID=339359 RepID=A0AAD5RFX8_9PEZI|nr:Zinc-regulated transporter 2 [Zalerion maritima]